MYSWIKNIAIVLLLILSVVFIYRDFTHKPEKIYIENVKLDTIFSERIIPGDVQYIKGDAIISYKTLVINDTISIRDTVLYTTPAFVASLDTIVRDTFNLKFFFPDNRFDFVFRPAPDTVQVLNIIKEIEKPKVWYDESWFRYSTLAISFGLGIYIGLSK